MKRLPLIYLFCLICILSTAQKINRSFRKEPLPEVLKYLDKMSERYSIFFIYDELEDFTVTADIRNKNIPDAVREAIGFYPMRVTFGDSIIKVECSRKEENRLIGRVVDEHGQSVGFANIVLLNPSDSSYMTGGVSNANGDFVIPCDLRRVLVKVSFVGYKTYLNIYNVGKIGTLKLQPETIMLKGVTVKSNLPKTYIRNDAMVTYVTGTILEKSGTTEDLLNNIPLVDVSDGNVEVFGRGAAEIYINGRKLQDNTELQQIASENIRYVEVVNNPGARYQASTKAVIRIKTKRPQGEGFGFTENAKLNYDRGLNGIQEQTDMNYRKGGLDISGRITARKNTDKEHKQNIIDTYLSSRWHHVSDFTRNTTTIKGTAMLQANYVINEDNSFGARYEFSRQPRMKEWGTYQSELYQDDTKTESSISVIEDNNRTGKHGLNVYYNGKAGNWTLDFNADGLWIASKGWSLSEEEISGGDYMKEEVEVKSEKNYHNTLVAAKLTAEHELFGGKLCIGGEVSGNTRNNGYTDESGLTVDDKSKVHERIIAGFMEYSLTVGRFEAVAGLRYENVNSDYYLYGVRQNEQSRRYNDWFPNFSLSGKIGKAFVQLSFSNDIERPGYDYLSNAVLYLNRYTYQKGNPLLRPMYAKNIILNVSYSYWLLSAGYRYIKDDYNGVFDIYNSDPSISVYYLDNMEPHRRLFLSVSASPKIGNIWYPKITASVIMQDYEADTPDGKKPFNRPKAVIKWNNTVNMPWKLRLDANLLFVPRGDLMNYRISKSYLWSEFGLRRDFLKDCLSLQMKVYDPFKIMKTRTDIYSGKTVYQNINNDAHAAVSLRAVYKFNVTRDKYKGKGAGNAEKNRL